jgi:hypothetical protein
MTSDISSSIGQENDENTKNNVFWDVYFDRNQPVFRGTYHLWGMAWIK